jgi:hypothetical protein
LSRPRPGVVATSHSSRGTWTAPCQSVAVISAMAVGFRTVYRWLTCWFCCGAGRERAVSRACGHTCALADVRRADGGLARPARRRVPNVPDRRGRRGGRLYLPAPGPAHPVAGRPGHPAQPSAARCRRSPSSATPPRPDVTDVLTDGGTPWPARAPDCRVVAGIFGSSPRYREDSDRLGPAVPNCAETVYLR